jgi:hypothetical protein
MIGVVFFCVGMSYFLTLILITELSVWLAATLREAREGLPLCDTDVFPDECVHPFPNHTPRP